MVSIALTQALAWFCGSIIRGQRLPRVTKMPLSMDTESVGKPHMFQSRTSTGLARTPRSEQSSDTGMSSSWHRRTHFSTSSSLYAPVNAPKYAMHAADKNTSPTKSEVWWPISSAVSFQRTCSSANPDVSFSARARRCTVSSAWSFRDCWSSMACCSCASSAATLSLTACSLSCAALSCAMVSASASSAALSALRLGSTTFATRL